MSENVLTINTVLDNKTVTLPYTKKTTAEDVCINLCKQLNIGNAARHLFALRVTNKQIFLMPAATFTAKHTTFDLRIRFKVPNEAKLKKLDANAYDYYFHQVRSDVLDNKIPDLIYEKYKRELSGLGITDMYRVMLEKKITRECVENDYKKYIPKVVIKQHSFFIKKPIREYLARMQKSVHDVSYVKAEYLKQFNSIAPEYLVEEFKSLTERDGSICCILVRVTPHHPTEPGIKFCTESKRDHWQQICTVDELGFVTIREDSTVEISRKNGLPFYLKFDSVPIMLSFVSLLDGYYRLMVKWTFNICKDVPTPSLQKLYSMKCHGPVGGEFSYAKLEEKRSNKLGCFILRESESKYNTYYIDVCVKDGLKPKTFKLEKLTEDEFIFDNDLTRYRSIHQLMAAYNDPQGNIYLHECLPPSEYDNSPLLLCQPDNISNDSLTDSSALNSLIPKSPLCISSKDLQVYKGQKREGSQGITVVYRSMWKVTKGKKLEAAVKILKSDSYERHLKDFLDLAGQWAFLQSSAIVRLFGIVLTTQVSMVLEYLRLGPLDQYLQEKKGILKQVDLIEASANLASALWHLEEHGIVHGNIRCRKLYVTCHDDNAFNVKLADPGIHSSYSSKEVHWIPIECYANLNFARHSTAADVWALATTLWEIFMFGETIKSTDHMEAMRFYASGKRLPQPSNCPNDIYYLMRECWDADPHRRKQPQAIMRDINLILYQVFNSRRTHSYAKVFPKSRYANQNIPGAVSSASLNSNATESTVLPSSDEYLITLNEMNSKGSTLSSLSLSHNWSLNSQENMIYEDSLSGNFSNILSTINLTATTSLSSINSMQTVIEFDDKYAVVFQGRIGQGFYGEVYRCTLEPLHSDNSNDKELVKQVAVKKLKTNAATLGLQDFEREINIMKSLKHPNIVEILGVFQEPEILLVMEYVQHGSLQCYLKIYRESLSTKQLLKYALDIAKGMDYLGKKNIVHRDLAARNILVVDENHVKISDFGLAQVMDTNEYYILKTTNRELPIKWYAPESLRDGKFSVRSDVWSFGVTMCEMFSHGEEPRLAINNQDKCEEQELQILLKALEDGVRFPCPINCPQAVYIRIIYPCWEADPHRRLLFAQLISETEDLLKQY